MENAHNKYRRGGGRGRGLNVGNSNSERTNFEGRGRGVNANQGSHRGSNTGGAGGSQRRGDGQRPPPPPPTRVGDAQRTPNAWGRDGGRRESVQSYGDGQRTPNAWGRDGGRRESIQSYGDGQRTPNAWGRDGGRRESNPSVSDEQRTPNAWAREGGRRESNPVVGDGQRTPNAWARGQFNQGSGGLNPKTDDTSTSATQSAAEGAAVVAEGRGAMRGKRVIHDMVISRPKTCVTKCGTAGTKVNIQTNYFSVLKRVEWSIYQYRVDFSPEIESIGARRYFIAQHKNILGGYIFDGTILFCVINLRQDQMELFTKNREDETIKIQLKLVGVVEKTDATQLQVLNLILRRAMEGLKMQLVRRNFYDAAAKIQLNQFGLEIWPGYTTSIRQHEREILLCCDIAHKVMRQDTLYHTLSQCYRGSGNVQDTFKSLVIGSVVLTDYNNKTYSITDVDFNINPMTTFTTKSGEISFADYYKKRYNITIRDLKQPMLLSRPKERDIRGGQTDLIILVPELCRATGMTADMRADFNLMKAMSEHTRIAPERRIERLRTYNRRLQDAAASVEVLKSWNMKLDHNLVEVPGRVLPSEDILFGNNKFFKCNNRADWTQQFRSNYMVTNRDLKRWYVITPDRNISGVQNFVRMCIKVAREMGMKIIDPRYSEMRDDRTSSYSDAIENAVVHDPQLVMVVLVRKNEEKYSCIKKKCCIDRPVPSQVVVLNTIAPSNQNKAAGLMSIATKVVIQMNAKLGGAPWLLNIPTDGLMTVGFDVCHSGKKKNMSYGAMVATMDMKRSSRFYSSVMQHEKGHELSKEISMHMSYALKAYKEEHKSLPKTILFYRDGVGDGQLHQVFDNEVKAVREKLDQIYKSEGFEDGCKFAFIVVSKRINTRYFVNRQNPEPGTIVDDIITLPERYDFFLVSQSVRQGTVSPTSYNIIYDTSGLSPNQLQILTYKLTHLYYNWSGTCRVPSVCQYAHKLAFLVAESLHRQPSNALESLLYFL